MKVHQCRENEAHAYSAATPVLYSVLIYCTPALPLCSRRQQKQGRDVCDVSPLLLVLLRVMRHWTIVYMHVLWL